MYKNKYLKYKNKYLKLLGGSELLLDNNLNILIHLDYKDLINFIFADIYYYTLLIKNIDNLIIRPEYQTFALIKFFYDHKLKNPTNYHENLNFFQEYYDKIPLLYYNINPMDYIEFNINNIINNYNVNLYYILIGIIIYNQTILTHEELKNFLHNQNF